MWKSILVPPTSCMRAALRGLQDTGDSPCSRRHWHSKNKSISQRSPGCAGIKLSQLDRGCNSLSSYQTMWNITPRVEALHDQSDRINIGFWMSWSSVSSLSLIPILVDESWWQIKLPWNFLNLAVTDLPSPSNQTLPWRAFAWCCQA